MAELKDVLAKNLYELRKGVSLTQLELAEKLNYSDKSVSKWEHGDAVPDIEVLARIAAFYNVTVDYLISEHKDAAGEAPINPEEKNRKRIRQNHIVITLLATCLVWIVATVIYTPLFIWAHINYWNVFVWAVPVSCIVLIVFNAIWGARRFSVVLTSALVWSFITALYLQLIDYNMWALYFIGAPLQVAIVLWARLKIKK